jgi:hypothetical protein
LSVVCAWPAANGRKPNRRVACLLLQFRAAGHGVHGFLLPPIRSGGNLPSMFLMSVGSRPASSSLTDGRRSAPWSPTDARDWSLAPVPDWAGQRILMRVSRSGDALTIRAKPSDHGNLQLIRVVPFEPELVAFAGPYACAPTRAGLTVRFHSWRSARPDRSLN